MTPVSYSDDFTSDYGINSVVNEGNPASYQNFLDNTGVEVGQSLPVAEVFQLDDVLLIGARFGVRSADHTWSATAWGRNITDEFQPINSRKQTDGVVRYTGRPATYGITLSYNWL